jgi:hypothetical protein
MKVIKPDTNTEVLQALSVLLNSRKKKTDAAIMAMVPIKNVKAT